MYLGLLLSSLLVIVSLCTHIVWQYYSPPIIADFSLREEIEKARKQQVEREKVASELLDQEEEIQFFSKIILRFMPCLILNSGESLWKRWEKG